MNHFHYWVVDDYVTYREDYRNGVLFQHLAEMGVLHGYHVEVARLSMAVHLEEHEHHEQLYLCGLAYLWSLAE